MNKSLPQNLKNRKILFFMLIGAMTFIHWLILVLKLPILSALPYWTFPLRDTPVTLVWIILGGSAILTAALIRFSNLPSVLKIFMVFLAGIALQFTFAFSKNHGLDGLRDRMIYTGHAEFVIAASHQFGFLETASNYERIAQEGDYQYIPSKPPGTLLFYMISNRIASLTNISLNDQIQSQRTFASITWPVITYIVIFLIFILSKFFFGIESALDASLLFITIPSINLITLHTDQTLYPLLAVLPFLLATFAFRKRNFWLSFISGITFYVAVFFSFGLIVIGAFFLVPFFLLVTEEFPKYLRISIMLLITAVAGTMVSDFLARLILQYNIYLRYTHAMKHHLGWKGWENTLQNFFNANTTNIVEFSVWIGIPVSLILFFAIFRSIKIVFIDNKPDSHSIFGSVLAGVFLLLLLVGKTKAETARLWLFLLPAICIISADYINRLSDNLQTRRAMVFFILLLEFGTAYFTLRYQDFF